MLVFAIHAITLTKLLLDMSHHWSILSWYISNHIIYTAYVSVFSPHFSLTDTSMCCFVSLSLSLRQTVPGWAPCRWGGWAGLIGAEGASGSATGTLNITCSMDTTSGLLFSLCNWADNVPWFPLFCTSVCSAWAARCVLVSWKWSGVSERSGYPPSLLQFCRWCWWHRPCSGSETSEGRVHPWLCYSLINETLRL